MRLSAFFIILLLIAYSCGGQAPPLLHPDISARIKVDTVEQPGKNIMLIFQDKQNNYWFGSWEDGLYRYDGKTLLHYTTRSGLPHHKIEEIKEDGNGNIFVSTSKGVGKFDGQKFTTLAVTGSENKWKLESGDLWFRACVDSGFIYRYNGADLYKLHLPKVDIGEEYVAKHPNNPNPYAVYSIYKDNKGYIWFGTAALGACRYNGRSFNWILEDDVTELHDGAANGVRSIIEDKHGFIWFNSGFRYKIADNNQQEFYTREKGPASLDGKPDGSMNKYLSIAKDSAGDLWIATYNDGVWQYNGKQFTHYPVKQLAKDVAVFSIYRDNHGILWLGTQESGVFRFNREAFEPYTF